MIRYLRYAGLAVVFAWFFGGGVTHFTNTGFFVAIVPPWWPWPLFAVYASGVFEVLLAILILWPAARPLAGWGLVVLTLAVTPANVNMWLHPEQFPDVSETALSVRLVIQVFLLALIWWSTRLPMPQTDDPYQTTPMARKFNWEAPPKIYDVSQVMRDFGNSSPMPAEVMDTKGYGHLGFSCGCGKIHEINDPYVEKIASFSSVKILFKCSGHYTKVRIKGFFSQTCISEWTCNKALLADFIKEHNL